MNVILNFFQNIEKKRMSPMSFREPMAHVRYGKNTELAGATPGVVRPMSTREADRAYRKAWRKNNPAWYTRLWRFLEKKR